MVKKISNWDPLRVLVMDIAGYVENYSKTVDMVSNNPAVISLVVMFNTDLDSTKQTYNEYKKANEEIVMSEDENSKDDSDDDVVNESALEKDEFEEYMNEETINSATSGNSVLDGDAEEELDDDATIMKTQMEDEETKPTTNVLETKAAEEDLDDEDENEDESKPAGSVMEMRRRRSRPPTTATCSRWLSGWSPRCSRSSCPRLRSRRRSLQVRTIGRS